MMGLLRRSSLGLVVIVILSLNYVKLSYGDDGAFSVGDWKHGGGSTMEELDNKYLLTDQIVELQGTVAKLEAAQKTHNLRKHITSPLSARTRRSATWRKSFRRHKINVTSRLRKPRSGLMLQRLRSKP